MCGIKNFVSVRLYSAPQSHWTIVSILGICADGGVDQTEIDRHIQRSLLPPVRGGRDRCREAVAARASCALSRPAAPMCPPPNGAHAWGKSSVGDTFIPTKSATPAMPHTWSDGPYGAKDFSTLALSPPPHDETAAEIFERLVAGNPRFKEAPKGQSLVIGGVRKPDADDVWDHRAERA